MNELEPYANIPESDIATRTVNSSDNKRYTHFSSNGRAGRTKYLAINLLYWVYAYCTLFLFSTALSLSETGNRFIFALLMAVSTIASLAILVAAVSLTAKRLHDVNLSAWYCLVILVPLVNVLCWLLLALIPGTHGANSFGQQPEKTTLLYRIAALVFIVIVFIVLMAVLLVFYEGFLGT